MRRLGLRRFDHSSRELEPMRGRALALAALAAVAAQVGASGSLAEPPAGQWVMAGKNYANTRYSDLDQINTGNVKNLTLAWTFSTGVLHGHEAAPLVVGDTLYVVTPFPNILYALDLTSQGALKWKYEPNPSRPPRAWPAATSSIAARPTPTGRSSSTPSTPSPWRWTRRRAARCGGRSSATSTAARR